MKTIIFIMTILSGLFFYSSSAWAEYYLVYPDTVYCRGNFPAYEASCGPCESYVYIRSKAPYRHAYKPGTGQVADYEWIGDP